MTCRLNLPENRLKLFLALLQSPSCPSYVLFRILLDLDTPEMHREKVEVEGYRLIVGIETQVSPGQRQATIGEQSELMKVGGVQSSSTLSA